MKRLTAEQKKIIPGLIASGFSLVGFFALLIFVGAAFLNSSFGWFANNKSVTSGGASITASTKNVRVYYAVETDGVYGAYVPLAQNTAANIVENLKTPGDSQNVRFKVVNISPAALSLTGFGLFAPASGEEVPITDENSVNRYFGTQVKISVTEINGTAHAGTQHYLLTLDGSGNPVPSDIALYSGSTVLAPSGESGSEIVFTVCSVFENKAEIQDVYKNFGVSSGTCVRRVYFTFE